MSRAPGGGRKPKPVAVQLAEGDPCKIGKRKLRQALESEPQATRGLPDCPRHLRGIARAAWALWSEELRVLKQDRLPDAHMLEGACMAYEDMVEAYRTVQEEGRNIEVKAINRKSGEVVVLAIKPHPAVSQGNHAKMILKAFCSEFGLSPVSRMRLRSDESRPAKENLAEILGRPRAPRTVTPPPDGGLVQ